MNHVPRLHSGNTNMNYRSGTPRKQQCLEKGHVRTEVTGFSKRLPTPRTVRIEVDHVKYALVETFVIETSAECKAAS